ncbi:MAG: hypothetical protein BWX71_01116 [Deltaproteobacteria bacterium ADurb.Bin072]|nr:MAG: hypothetical protein BWX71_01116 [Deltaproteobacteria bacterium ADurb.Bin072]
MVVRVRFRSFLIIDHSTMQNPRITAKTMAHETGSRRDVKA